MFPEERFCDSPVIRVFFDPRPDLGTKMRDSKCRLYEAMMGELTVNRGPNWVVATDMSGIKALFKLNGQAC